MSEKGSQSVRELLEKFRAGYYIEYEFYTSLARRACSDEWNEVLTNLPPDVLKKFRRWVHESFPGPGIDMVLIGNASPPRLYSKEQEEFLFRWGREGVEDNKDSGGR